MNQNLKTAVPLAFKAVVLTPNHQLLSIYDKSLWVDNALTASCRNNFHLAPDSSCTCGIYGARFEHQPLSWTHLRVVESDGRYFLENFSDKPASGWVVVGVVEALGRVELHDKGWRAQYARFLNLIEVPATRNQQPLRDGDVVRSGKTPLPVINLARAYHLVYNSWANYG